MIILAVALLSAAQSPDIPPCKGGRSTCEPWERDWPSSADRDKGPFNLILRWGSSLPIAIRYESDGRCEMAVQELRLVGHAVARDGSLSKPNSTDAINAFCIPG